jgi:uncharacterized protein YutE (UPF0331/DUF86 family)
MVERARLRNLLSRLAGRYEELAAYGRLALDEYLAARERVNASKYLLVTAIEDTLSIANHVIASEGLRGPSDYADAFRSLAEAGVIRRDLAQRLEAMARFRNLLVHVYTEVDDRRVHAFLREDVADLRAFARAILDHFPELGAQ